MISQESEEQVRAEEVVATYHLHDDPEQIEPELDAAAFGVLADPVADWDEMPGSFSTQSARPGTSAKELVEMELSSDFNRWIIGCPFCTFYELTFNGTRPLVFRFVVQKMRNKQN